MKTALEAASKKNSIYEPNGGEWNAAIAKILSPLPLAHHLPLLNILRLLLLEKSAVEFYLHKPDIIVDIIQHANEVRSDRLVIITLQILCNSFTYNALLATCLFLSITSCDTLTTLVISALHSNDSRVLRSAASLAFNISIWITQCRKEHGPKEEESWEIRIAEAIIHATKTSIDEDTLHRLTSSLSYLLFDVPAESELPNLLNMLNISETLETKVKEGRIQTDKVRKACEKLTDTLKKHLQSDIVPSFNQQDQVNLTNESEHRMEPDDQEQLLEKQNYEQSSEGSTTATHLGDGKR
jgi:PUL domain